MADDIQVAVDAAGVAVVTLNWPGRNVVVAMARPESTATLPGGATSGW
jgi:hypothetical protein